jgi:hypothetical protein
MPNCRQLPIYRQSVPVVRQFRPAMPGYSKPEAAPLKPPRPAIHSSVDSSGYAAPRRAAGSTTLAGDARASVRGRERDATSRRAK